MCYFTKTNSMRKLFIFILTTVTFFANAQRVAHINKKSGINKVSFGCNFFGDSQDYTPAQATGINDDKAHTWMTGIIDDIVAKVGLQARFEVKALKNYNNCSALCVKNETGETRVLQFDRDFLEQYEKITADKWFVVGVVAHEIAHHLNGHSLDGVGSRPNKEMEADEFAGFVMQKLGATLSESQNIFSFLNETEGPPTHPIKSKRYKAVKRGWDKSAGTYESWKDDDEVGMFALTESLLKVMRNKRKPEHARAMVDLCNNILNLTPDNIEALSTKGYHYATLKMYDSAKIFCTAALKVEPHVSLFRLNLAKVLLASGEFEDALAYIDDAVYLRPISPEAYETKAEILIKQRKYFDAIENCNLALLLSPTKENNIADILAAKGIAFYELGKKVDALILFKEAKKYEAENILLGDYVKGKRIAL
jgi:tetratricopeptide (TPR) repeat protein